MSRIIQAPLWGQQRDPVHKRNYRPGQHGRSAFRSPSEFGKQITAKQCFKWYYLVREKQFRRIFNLALRKKGNTSDLLVGFLESRLTSVLYNSGFVRTIFAAKQFVSHKHVMVNGRVVNRASYMLKPGDVIKLVDAAKDMKPVLEAIDSPERKVPDYMEVDVDKREAKLIKIPTFAEIPYPTKMRPGMVIEFYSK